MVKKDLTELQKEVFEYCENYLRDNDQLPSYKTISDAFKWKAATAARCHIMALLRKGWLERNEAGHFRFKKEK